MSTHRKRYEDLTDDQLAIAAQLAEEDDELGPVFEAMLEDIHPAGDHS